MFMPNDDILHCNPPASDAGFPVRNTRCDFNVPINNRDSHDTLHEDVLGHKERRDHKETAD